MNVTEGTRLGPYSIVSRIGAGGMGEVWRARDTRIGRDVALKVLPAAFASDPDRLHRFEQEARAAGTLNHPNVVTLFDAGADDGVPYVVMELLEGETLRDRLESATGQVRLPVRKALDYAVQIASGLVAAHEKGVVHRDLKPENIFITNDGRVKILDFGLAKLAAPLDDGVTNARTEQRNTAPGAVLGTAGYMSPEQVRGRNVDHRTDIFAFGAILYEMLAGARAFKGDSAADTMSAILREEPPELATVAIPPALDSIVRHCLEKAPEERFQSAKDLAFDLQRLTAGSGSSPALAATARRRTSMWPAIFAALAAAAIAGAWFIGRRSAASAPVASPPVAATRAFHQLTYGPFDVDPVLAPDGKMFAFVSRRGGKEDIFVQRVDGRNAINLTKDSPEEDVAPAFSADGSQIAFRSERDGGGIFIMGATGESVRRLTDFGENPAWSPDGKQIAVGTDTIFDNPTGRSGRSAIWTIEIATGARRQLTRSDGVQPSWSPHGTRIAYWRLNGAGGERRIYTIDPHAADPEASKTVVTQGRAIDWSPVWSSDGKWLYFGSDRDGTQNIWRVPIDESSGRTTGAAEPVGLPAKFAMRPSFARDGTLAFATRDVIASVTIFPFDPAAGRITGTAHAILGGSMLVFNMNLSADGQWLVFNNVRSPQDIYLARTDGSEVRQLTNDPERDRGPDFSADGKVIYFYSQRGQRYEIWSIRTDGSGLRQVSNTPTDPHSWWYPRPLPGRNALYVFNDVAAAILPLNAQGTAEPAERLPPMPDPAAHFQEVAASPDAARFAGTVAAPQEAAGVWIYTTAAKQYRRLFGPHDNAGASGPFTNLRHPAWLPDAKRLLVHDDEHVFLVDAISGARTELQLPVKGIDAISLSRDGRTLAVSSGTSLYEVWAMTTAPPNAH